MWTIKSRVTLGLGVCVCALGGRGVGVWSCPALLECLGRLDLPGTCVLEVSWFWCDPRLPHVGSYLRHVLGVWCPLKGNSTRDFPSGQCWGSRPRGLSFPLRGAVDRQQQWAPCVYGGLVYSFSLATILPPSVWKGGSYPRLLNPGESLGSLG